MSAPEKLEEEVQRLADEYSIELLPMLYERFMVRNGLSACHRHDILLPAYFEARKELQIAVDTDESNYMGESYVMQCFDMVQMKLQLFKAVPCRCWVEDLSRKVTG